MFCFNPDSTLLKNRNLFFDGSNEPSLYLYTVSFSLVTQFPYWWELLFFLFSSFDVSISLLRYMLLLKELYRLSFTVWLFISAYHCGKWLSFFCFPFGSAKVSIFLYSPKNILFIFCILFRLKTCLRLLICRFSICSRSLRLGVQR